MKLYQDKETKDLCMLLKETDMNGNIRLKHLHAPIWETITPEQLEQGYTKIEQADDIE